MSPRPSLTPNSYGEIGVAPTGATSRDSRYKARARYRDRTGNYRYVARFGQTKREAERRLKTALEDLAQGSGGVAAATPISDLADQWLATLAGRDLATQTRQLYTYAVARYVTPQLGSLRVVEASTPLVDAALKRVTAAHGPSAAKSTRAVLNGMFGLAVRHGALTVNPVRDTEPMSAARRTVMALTPDQVDRLTDGLRSDAVAVDHDLPDLVDFMLATGCRIGEALAVRDEVLSPGAATVEIDATVIRAKGEGLVVQRRPKTAAGWRVLALPGYAVEMLRRRDAERRFRAPEAVLFPSPFRPSLRDPSNTQKALRAVFDRLGFEQATSHTLRKTVATRLDEAGWTARQIADQLGHARPSMTMDVYMGRKVVGADAARILER